MALVEIVWNAASIEHGECGSIKGVLRNWNEDAAFGLRADDVKERVNTGRSSCAEEDVGRVCWVAISSWSLQSVLSRLLAVCSVRRTLDELRNALPNAWNALALAVGSYTLNFLQ